MPYKIPKNRTTVKTIKMKNGILTGEADNQGNMYWFKDGKYITPYQMESYKYYDPSIKGYRKLGNRAKISVSSGTVDFNDVYNPVYTPNLDRLYSEAARKRKEKNVLKQEQAIPLQNQDWITLRTKGKMNLTDIPMNMLDSIAVNAGRSGTDFWTDMGLVGKESTFYGLSKALGRPYNPSMAPVNVHALTNNHAWLNSPEDDYVAAVNKILYPDPFKETLTDAKKVEAENNVKYATEHGLIKGNTPQYSDYILADAFKRYQTNPAGYNPGQKSYVPMLNGIRQELQGEKQLQNYWNTRGKQEYAIGQKEGMAYGGSLKGRTWDKLSMAEKADVMKLAIEGGVYDLDAIRSGYNKFAEGGSEEEEVTTSPSNSDIAMTAMMKSKLATAAHYGNPTARRMTNYDTRSYTWPNEYEYDRGIGEPRKGNVFVGSYDNLVTPQIQDNSYSLEFVDDVWSPENDRRSYMQSIKFDNPRDAQYFGEHYKEVAPMMNLFAKGGNISEEEYIKTMERVAEENYKKWGYSNPDEALIHALNDNTYNYRGYYNKYPQSAANADTHWPDEFKTVYHPTFSRESIYSGQKSQYNPNGRIGGFWLSEDLFVPAPWQLFNNHAEGGKIYIKPENRGKFTALKERTGHSATWFKEHGTPAQKKMATFALNSKKWKHGLGGNLFEGGGRTLEYNPDEDYYYAGRLFPGKELIVTGKNRKEKPYWVTSRTPQLTFSDVVKGIDVATGPLLHWMQPSQYVGALRDANEGKNPLVSMLRGNSGITSEEYTQEHPYLSTVFNLGVDAAILGGPAAVSKTLRGVENVRYPLGKPLIPQNFTELSPQVRTRLGDVEINNPGVNYRVGTKEIVDDFTNSGIVRAGETNAQKAKRAGRFLLTKETFTNPMFKQGSLWYQPSEEMSGLLTTSEPLITATKSSAPVANSGIFTIEGKTFANDFGGRRIPGEGQVLDASNTSAFIYEPNYGYRKVFAKESPAAEWAMGRTTPKITAENASSITLEQWTAAQDAAIARGDMAEAQRLRDLHFRTYQNGDMVDVNGNPIHVYHGSPEENITEFYKPNDSRLPIPKGINFKATGEEGIYTSPSRGYAANYMVDLGGRYKIPLTKEQKILLKAGKTREELGLPRPPQGRLYDLYSNTKLVPEDLEIDFNPFTLSTKEANLIKSKGYSGYDIPGKKHPEHVVLEPNQLKSADAVTYDNNGVRIPLGKRDNFNINDIRYGLLPFGIGLTGYGLLNNQEAFGGNIKKRKR